MGYALFTGAQSMVPDTVSAYFATAQSWPGPEKVIFEYQTTQLCKAVKEGDVEQVKLLIETNANPNEKDTWGLTPLMVAALNEKKIVRSTRELIVAQLINGGASLNIRRTPTNSIIMTSSTFGEQEQSYTLMGTTMGNPGKVVDYCPSVGGHFAGKAQMIPKNRMLLEITRKETTALEIARQKNDNAFADFLSQLETEEIS